MLAGTGAAWAEAPNPVERVKLLEVAGAGAGAAAAEEDTGRLLRVGLRVKTDVLTCES